MTVIRPNSISGITSLTAHRGSIDFYAHDGSAATFNNINSNVTSGVSTFASLNITGDLDVGGALTYEDVTNVDSVGVITARNGIHVSGGNIGIGENNPQNSLHISGSTPAIRFVDSGANGSAFSIIEDNNGLLKIRNDAGNSGTGSGIAFEVDAAQRLHITSGGVKQVKNGNLNIYQTYIDFSGDQSSTPQTAVALYRPADGTFAISTQNTERVRITSDGKMGLGTSSPARGGLHIHKAATAELHLTDDTTGDSSGDGFTLFSTSSSAGVWYRENAPLRFATYNTERVRISSGGNVGINDTAPSEKLNVGGNIMLEGSDQFLYLTNVGTGNAGMYIRGRDATSELRSHSTGIFTWEVTGSEKMRISSTGNTNIGSGYIVSNSGLHVGRSSGGTAAGESVIAATLGNDSTMVSALLTVKNAGNRGAAGATGGSPLAKFEFNNGTAFEIDKNGYRTLPYQPCAMAYNAQGQHMPGAAVAQFNSTRFNIGNIYNSSNGRMTVPVAGRYLVAYSGLHDYVSQNNVGFDIRINGSAFNGGEGYQSGSNISNTQLSKTLILNLSANDYVEIYIRSSGTQVHQRYGSFSVTLIT